VRSMRSLLAEVRDELPQRPGPVVIFNKSHSGSRLLAALVEQAGVFMGAHQNESHDSLDVLELVTHLVLAHYPEYGQLLDGDAAGDSLLPDLVRRVFGSHLAAFDAGGGGRWGWKLCETSHIVPVVDVLFPGARFIHLIRDGRDVAFSDHVAPSAPFWRKIYFNTDRITHWRGRRLDRRAYRRCSHLFNARHWVNSVTVGRRYGALLGERYLEVRYEELCLEFERTAARVLAFIGMEAAFPAVAAMKPRVRGGAIGKYRRQPWLRRRTVAGVVTPLLRELGYLEGKG
jgi:hypothetical protein